MNQDLPNIILIVVDALRARNLSCYGYPLPTSPNIDRLAEDGTLFYNAYSCTNVTDSSLTSMLSGRYPISHGIINTAGRVQEEEIHAFVTRKTKLLSELLKLRGYSTLAVDWLGRWHKTGYDHYGLQQSKVKYHGGSIAEKLPRPVQSFITNMYKSLSRMTHRWSQSPPPPGARSVTAQTINLIEQNRDRNFFLLVHYWDTHTPYNAPKQYVERFCKEAKGIEIEGVLNSINNLKWREKLQQATTEARTTREIIARYDGAIALIDYEIRRLVETLRNRGILDQTLIILTSDHGESLTEHGIWFDHHGLYDESIHVPLILRYPRKIPSNKRISALVQHVDIVPTILDLLGMRIDYDLDGTSFIPLIHDEVHQLRPAVYAEEAYTQRKRAIRTKDYKYIYSLSGKEAICRYCGYSHGGAEELYDLNEDPGETLNIAEKRPPVLYELKKQLTDWADYLEYKSSMRGKRRLKEKIRQLRNYGEI